MKKFKFESYGSSSHLLQSPKASAFVGCTHDSGWEVVWVNRKPFVDPAELDRYGEEYILVDSSVVWVETPSGRKVNVDLRKNKVFYL